MFLLLTGDTEAGSRQPFRFASHEEANLVWWGGPVPGDLSRILREYPSPPAMFTRAARLVSDLPVMIVRAGTFTPPVCPFMETGAHPGGDPRREAAVPDALRLWDCGFSIGRLSARMGGPVVIGASIPGGGATASLLLRAIGPDPVDISCEAAWQEVSSRIGIEPGGLSERGFDAVSELGDPVQIVAAGAAAGSRSGAEVVLAGGYPMLAVAALLRSFGDTAPITLATTGLTAGGSGSSFRSIAASLKTDLLEVPLDDVHDGAGAAGAAWYAERLGVTLEQITLRAELLRSELSKEPPAGSEG